MSATKLAAIETPTFDVPEDLNSPESKLVYLFLTASGGATVDDLHESLGIRKISLFPVLDTLTERDHVARDGNTYLPSAS
ncbi:MAG: TrmB family transcriptional regulator [Haloplanus sp.]